MESIEKKYREELVNLKDKFKEDRIAIEFEESAIEFERLVNTGKISKRGYNLLSPTDFYLKNKSAFIYNSIK